ncbi:sulfatase-like hydrolase/transferase [Draconibacterium sp.]|nr:sulfatase-like hydrolase/transferase [Draconibacterium sp.]
MAILKQESYSSPFKLLGILLIFLICSSCNPTSKENSQKPNIILIFTDQQTANAMSCTGNPYLKTPAMDLLANEGIMFRNAYCTSPVCGPARSSIISGRMPHETGVEWNGQSMYGHVTNSGEIFRKNGYQTVWAGKWHLPESYPQREAAENKVVKGFDILPFWDSKQPRWFLGAETDPPLTNAIVQYLENYDKKNPLFLAVSYHNPHDICMYPRKAGWVSKNDSLLEIRHYGFKHKLPDVIGIHPNQFENLPPLPFNHEIQENEPDFIQEKRKNHNEYGVETKMSNNEFGELEWRGYLNAYYRLTEMVDKEIGKVIDALKAKGYWENSLIIFTSDHGDGAAAHKWAAKLSLYEESSKIPMIVVYPGKIPSGKVDDKHLVSQIDILPTMLNYADIDSKISFTGESIKPIIDSPKAGWRDYLVTELADFKNDTTRKGRMVRTANFKYNIFSTGEEQLFDIENDPGEMHNLAGKNNFETIRIKSQQNLKQWAEKTDDRFATQVLK